MPVGSPRLNPGCGKLAAAALPAAALPPADVVFHVFHYGETSSSRNVLVK
jgi:hypothetical protein